jgi:hypothetical protein
MEQQGDGLEVRSDAAGEDADAVAWDEGEAAVAWDEGEASVAWDEDAVAWDQGESDALDPDGPRALDPDGPPGLRPAIGEPRVDAALARLDELAGRPVTEHRAIFEDVHRRLRDVLGELDTREQSSGDQAPAAGAERRAGS